MNNPLIGEGLKNILKAVDKYKYVLLVLIIGIVILLVPSSDSDSKASATAAKAASVDFSLEEFQNRLESVLSQIDGAGKVAVTLTIKTGEERIVAVDQQVSRNTYDESGVKRTESEEKHSTVVMSSGGGGQEVVVLKSIYPTFQGALIVCEGGDSASVRLKISEAVSALTGLGADKISVVKMKK